MFVLTMGPGMCMAFPDVCKTPIIVPVPIPYPNISESSLVDVAAETILVDGLPALNQLSEIELSQGDDAGVELGLISEDLMGMTNFIVGSIGVIMDGAPAQRLTSVTGQNAMEVLDNIVGACIVPSQFQVLALI